MSREFKYILVNKLPVATSDMELWGEWMQKNDRIVKQEDIGPFFVSTVFLGVDHSFDEHAPPVLFETMVFGDEIQNEVFKMPVRMRESLDEATLFNRYSTWEQAEEGHKEIAHRVRRKLMKLVV